ncbi:MAG: long-chain acyl-CoA synthetase [Solirubrobacteraceae bacterium]|nr:long-chain acyl-CoA synthetase [Solirubrobacteraceae bacterium]
METNGSSLGTEATTLPTAFRATAARHADDVAIRTKGDEQTLTWAELLRRSDALAGGLAELGVGAGDSVALMLSNRPEFHLADAAAMTLGATPFSIYQTYAPGQIAYVVGDAEARVAIVEQQHLPRLLEARADLPDLAHVIVVDDPAPEDAADQAGAGVLRLADVEASAPADFDGAATAAKVEAGDVATLIYTSGTTGPPKGVELTHRNLIATCNAAHRVLHFPDGARVISWLPAAHVAERVAHHYLPLVRGLQVTCCPDPRQVLGYLPEVRPYWFFAVPRIWEKLKSGLETMIAGQPEDQRAATEAAIAAAVDRVRRQQRGEPIPAELEVQVAAADAEIFTGWRAMLGLDQVAEINVGAAPTAVPVLEFFHAIGLPVAELWGLSETCGVGTVNPIERIKIGSVGPPLDGVELALDPDDGEVLMRGEVVMAGYRNRPEETAASIDADGWFHTGDVGRLDDDGYLTIVDRKKELIINAAGKNMSPANIESALKSSTPLIGWACCIGDRRPYNTALLVLDADFAPAWAAQHGIEGATLEQLAGEAGVLGVVQAAVDSANAGLARVEQIKKFTIVPGDWVPGGDELTPTMKLKRKPIAEKYAAEIEAMYA